MRLVNQRLLDPSQALTNEIIGSVVMLAGFEVFSSNILILEISDRS